MEILKTIPPVVVEVEVLKGGLAMEREQKPQKNGRPKKGKMRKLNEQVFVRFLQNIEFGVDEQSLVGK